MKLSKFLLISSILTGLVFLTKALGAPQTRALDYQDDDEDPLDDYRIRELAQQIWESEGKPEGQAARHWAMATELLKSSLANRRGRNEGVSHSDPYIYADKNSVH